jgi:hypothetical protein
MIILSIFGACINVDTGGNTLLARCSWQAGSNSACMQILQILEATSCCTAVQTASVLASH